MVDHEGRICILENFVRKEFSYFLELLLCLILVIMQQLPKTAKWSVFTQPWTETGQSAELKASPKCSAREEPPVRWKGLDQLDATH